MTHYPQGSEITIHFEGSIADGEIFETTYDDEPMMFSIGQEEILEDIEKLIQTMDIGQTKALHVTCEQAYGTYQDAKVINVPKTSLPVSRNINAGEQIIVRTPDDEELPAIILSVDETTVTIDANHPLAGEDLDFRITLLAVTPPQA